MHSKAWAIEMLREWRRVLKTIGNHSYSLEYCVPPRFMVDKKRLTLLGMKLKHASLLRNFEIRATRLRDGMCLRLEAVRRTTSRIAKYVTCADIEVLESLIADVSTVSQAPREELPREE